MLYNSNSLAPIHEANKVVAVIRKQAQPSTTGGDIEAAEYEAWKAYFCEDSSTPFAGQVLDLMTSMPPAVVEVITPEVIVADRNAKPKRVKRSTDDTWSYTSSNPQPQSVKAQKARASQFRAFIKRGNDQDKKQYGEPWMDAANLRTWCTAFRKCNDWAGLITMTHGWDTACREAIPQDMWDYAQFMCKQTQA